MVPKKMVYIKEWDLNLYVIDAEIQLQVSHAWPVEAVI